MDRKTYFFQPEKKLMNQGFFLQDEQKSVVYEAKCLKAPLFGPAVFEFVNHVSGASVQHKVGKTVTSEQTDAFGMTSITGSSFKFDDANVWKYLREKGASIETSSPGGLLSFLFTVMIGGQEAAVIEPAAPGGGPAVIPNGSYFNITTSEDYLDLAFLAAFAIAKTDAVATR